MGILKLPGLASGLDTENLIKTLMSVERRPLTALAKKRDTLTQEANAWRDLNTRLLTLQKRVDELKSLTDADFMARRGQSSDSGIATVGSITSVAATGTYSVEVVTLATATSMLSGPVTNGVAPDPDVIADPEADLNLKGVVSVTVGTEAAKSFTVAETDSLNDIVKKINDKSSELGITASIMQVSPGDYRLVLKGQNGQAKDFTISDGDADQAATKLGLTAGAGATKQVVAANGSIKVNGVTVAIADNVVKDAVGGATLTLSKVGTTTVTISKDYGKASAAIKAVVDQYNNVMELMATQTSYDDKTKATGPLFGNNRVRDIQDAIRTRLFDNVEGLPDEFKNLGILGVGTEKFKSGEKMATRLTFDQDKFNKAMDKDPAQVRQAFVKSGDNRAEQGVAVRLGSYLDNYTRTDGILSAEVKALDKGIELVKARITKFEEFTLPQKEQQLRAQFLNLEKSMSTFQNQGTWLSGQIKGLASWSPQ